MNSCSLCDVKLTLENDSKEHIIPNSVGGRKKTKGFLCQTCNSKTGDEWDTVLSEQLNPLSLIFFIQRERGDPPSQTFNTSEGISLTLHSEGGMSPAKVDFKEEIVDGKTKIRIVARDMREAKSILKGVKKKHPSIDIEKLTFGLQPTQEYLSGMLEFDLTLGGVSAGKSIVKSALALAHSVGVASNSCEQALQYLRDDGIPCFGYYYEKDLVINRPPKIPLHCVAIHGNPETGLLLGYIEYFGIHRIVICLSERYRGKALSASYSVDPTTGAELILKVDIALNQDDIQETYNYEKYDSAKVRQCFEEVIPVALEMSEKREQARVISEATDFAFKNCGAKEGEALTAEQYKKLCQLMAEKLTPYLLHVWKT
ncbi:HNH endonuclease [Pseudomonas sp. N3-W]|uniref:HNH endonuclease n=1 Tax=Pseudomonas sp. N3-W TaxID=2975049 RepID=UPI00217EF36C|nr:HNH endonuclease [Pseudomonas sp. N3-W]UWF49679.1 HNH endonuclease [Pseudomonas sp. N3-W]